jgi:hypothetical protein
MLHQLQQLKTKAWSFYFKRPFSFFSFFIIVWLLSCVEGKQESGKTAELFSIQLRWAVQEFSFSTSLLKYS